MNNNEEKGDMSVREAGHLGGQRERELVEEGREAEESEDKEDVSQGMGSDEDEDDEED